MKTKLPNLKNILCICLLFAVSSTMSGMHCYAQGAAISASNTVPDPSAILDVSSSTAPYQGMLVPRMNTANRNSIVSPATGLQIFNTDCNINEYYTGSCWVSLGQNLKTPGLMTCSGTTDFCANETRTFTIAMVTGATNYVWSVPAGAIITSGQGATSVNVQFGNHAGSVCVRAENNCETSQSSCIDVYINPIPSTPGNITGLTNVYPGDNGISYFIASIVGATLYNWTVPTGCVITSGIGTSNIMVRFPCNATSSNISVTASTNCGASPPSGLAITVNPVLSASAGTAVFGGVAIGGSPTASGGKAPYTYAWSPSANLSSTVATNPIALCSGSTTTYTVTVTDVNGCTASNAVVVTRNLVANAGFPQTGPGTIGGSPTATGGQIPYSYTWSPSSGLSSTTIANPYANACATTTYTVTVTDANGCTATNSITVTHNIVASAGSSFSGPGTIGGSPTVTGGKSPYTYSWNTSSGLSSTTVANPYATSCVTTTYTITVTDINSCTASNSITVTRNIAANAGSNFNRIGGCDTIGGIPVGTGGRTPYIYSWSPATGLSSTTEARPQINTTTSATYTVTVTDANACTATSSIVYTVVPATFSYTGSSQTFTVPACVTSITIQAYGAQGGHGYGNCGSQTGQTGGLGGLAYGSLSVTPGQTLYVYVGGVGGAGGNAIGGAGGWNGGGNAYLSPESCYGGGGGGGASDVRVGGTALSNRIIVGGGGGGGGSNNGAYGGYGGYPNGSQGYNGGGSGGTQSAGGSGSNAGTSGTGGNSSSDCGAGGGGGYWGGGASSGCNSQGAGGGSSYYGGMTSATGNTDNTRSGNGQVIITY